MTDGLQNRRCGKEQAAENVIWGNDEISIIVALAYGTLLFLRDIV